ncbi:hypothetical protein [Arthrobacter sp. B10-11]|uniref:hypothetical protein n=1 Tax=Arthrobacter sp. B10-11 TaxID=3081160 RepID=UPI002953A271|nr:hypothetical protein [Arthrobacter sp. B10-11]MDV8148934.1 hypothetical protein [Arthrobacter sp. B10-11]
MGSVKAVDAHYETHFGGEPEYWKFDNRPGTIGVLEWPKGTSRHRVHLYATLGLHALVPAPLNHEHGFELYTRVSAGSETFRAAFGMMANDLITDGLFLEHGHLVTPSNGHIVEGLPFRSWLMLERIDDFMPKLHLDNGHHVSLHGRHTSLRRRGTAREGTRLGRAL